MPIAKKVFDWNRWLGLFSRSGMHPLVAYSRAYDFVEVNSTFYVLPSLSRAEHWRKIVPEDFEFTVRCNRIVSHKFKFRPTDNALTVFEENIKICKKLRAELLHVLIPKSIQPNYALAGSIREFLNSARTDGIRLVIETRGEQPDEKFLKLMQDLNMIHCVDLSRDEKPAVESDILYSRLFVRECITSISRLMRNLKKLTRWLLGEIMKRLCFAFTSLRCIGCC